MKAQFQPANLGLCTTALALATFMQVLDTTIANVSLPTIAGNLGVSSDNSTWIVTAFAVAMVAIKTFLALIRRLDFIPFAIYRFLLAFVVYLVFVA